MLPGFSISFFHMNTTKGTSHPLYFKLYSIYDIGGLVIASYLNVYMIKWNFLYESFKLDL